MIVSGHEIAAVPLNEVEDPLLPYQEPLKKLGPAVLFGLNDGLGVEYLLEANSRRLGSDPKVDEWRLWPLGAEPIGSLGGESLEGGITILGELRLLTWSRQGWIGEPFDLGKPNQPYAARLSTPFSMDRSISIYPRNGVRQSISIGSVVLDNGDGALDGLVASDAIDGRVVTVSVGPYYRDAVLRTRSDYSKFEVILNALGVGWKPSVSSIEIELKPGTVNLDVPIQQLTYTGEGGFTGNDDLKDKTKPMCFGICRNVAPVLVDSVNNVYQVHSRRIAAIDAVRDTGQAISFTEDYPTGASLLAALPSVPAGSYATCLAEGLFALKSPPAGQVTADVRGDADPGYVNDTGRIVLRILLDIHDISSDAVDWDAFNALHGRPVGLYLPAGSERTVSDVISALVRGVYGWWGGNRLGVVTCGLFTAPEAPTNVVVGDLHQGNLISADPLDLPEAPRWRQTLHYRRNYTIQDDLPDSVAQEQRAEWSEPGRTAKIGKPHVLSEHAAATEGELDVLFDLAEDAEDCIERILACLGARRMMIRAVAAGHATALEIGDLVTFTWPRWGLESGKIMRIIGIDENAAAARITFTLWG